MELNRPVLDKDITLRIMKDRGYDLVSTANQEKTLNFAKYDDELNVVFNASVNVPTEFITIDMVQLKLGFTLTSNRFDFYHKRFAEFEQKLEQYTRACFSSDGIPIDPTVTPIDLPEEKLKKKKKEIEERKREFWDKIVPIAKQKKLDKDFTKSFWEYWTEHGEKDKTFRMERENVFDISKRLNTFVKNENKWNKTKQTFTDKKAEEQNKQLKNNQPSIDTTELF